MTESGQGARAGDGKAEPYDSRGPTTLEGWRSAALAGEKERDYLRERLQTVDRHQGKDCWYWQNDGEDHLESLTNALPVVIRADHLRALLAAAPAARRQAEPVAVLETPDGVIDLRAIAEQAGISMDLWDMGAASHAYSFGVDGISREHLEKFAQLYGFACWNAALVANPPHLQGFVGRALDSLFQAPATADGRQP